MHREEAGALPYEPVERPAPLFHIACAVGVGLTLAWFFPQQDAWWLLGSLGAAVAWAWIMARWLPHRRRLVISAMASLWVAWAMATPVYHQKPDNDLSKVAGVVPGTMELRLIPLEEPEWKPKGRDQFSAHVVCEVLAVNRGGGWRSASGNVWVRLQGDPEGRRFYGREAVVGGYLNEPDLPDGPGQFDFPGLLKTRGMDFVFAASLNHWKETGSFRGWLVWEWANHLRDYMRRVLSIGLEEGSPWNDLMAGMLFGYRDGISTELMHQFTVTGTVHLFAVSGQNVGMVLWFFLLGLKICGIIRWRWGWLVIPGLVMFCLSTGMESSAARALVMVLLVMGAWLFYRPVTPLNTVGTAALLLWIWDPWQFLDLGFQLSFLVLLGLLVLALPLARWVYVFGRPDVFVPRARLPRWRLWVDQFWAQCCLLASASTAAWLASQPLLAWHFGLVAPVTVFSNMLVVPLGGMVVVLALASVLVSPLSWWFSAVLNTLNMWVLQVITLVVGVLSGLPGGYFYLNKDSSLTPDSFKVTVVSADRQAPLIIEKKGWAMGVGWGSEADWRYRIDPARRHLGINSWDALWVTQAGKRSMEGVFTMSEQMPVEWLFRFPHPARTTVHREWMERRALGWKPARFESLMASGQSVAWGPLQVKATVLWPPLHRSDLNAENAGLVVLFEVDEMSLLWTGNTGVSVERELLSNGNLPHCDILIQGPHSKEENMTEEWLSSLRPGIIIRPSSGFYPEADLSMDKRIFIKNLEANLFELGLEGSMQLRGNSTHVDVLRWDKTKKEFIK